MRIRKASRTVDTELESGLVWCGRQRCLVLDGKILSMDALRWDVETLETWPPRENLPRRGKDRR